MDLLVNDLSMHGQFADVGTFRQAIGVVMAMRECARRYGRALYCHRGLASASVSATLTMQQAVQQLDRDQKRAVIQWLNQHGPFWDDDREHEDGDYLECGESPVTESGVGEAAWRTAHGVPHGLVGFSPSDWCRTPIQVAWHPDGAPSSTIDVPNHWTVDTLEAALRAAPVPITSWSALESVVIARFQNLVFSPDCFTHLHGAPFIHAAANRILVLCETLDRFRTCFDADGKRSTEGHRLYAEFFADKGGSAKSRGRAWFTDSSDDEKNAFRQEMTFPDPLRPGEQVFCPWHGKIRAGVMRMHFTWPVTASTPLVVAYVGPKRTKR